MNFSTDWWNEATPINEDGIAKVTATMINPRGEERMVYAGLYIELIKTGLLMHPAYVNAVAKGCNLVIKSVTSEDCDKAIEKIEFEASLTGENMKKWKGKS